MVGKTHRCNSKRKGAESKITIIGSPDINSVDGVNQYVHSHNKRPYNPPVGLVTAETDQEGPKKKYTYDPHLDPVLDFDSRKQRDELAEIIRRGLKAATIEEAKEALGYLVKAQEPYLNWAGKAEHTSFEAMKQPPRRGKDNIVLWRGIKLRSLQDQSGCALPTSRTGKTVSSGSLAKLSLRSLRNSSAIDFTANTQLFFKSLDQEIIVHDATTLYTRQFNGLFPCGFRDVYRVDEDSIQSHIREDHVLTETYSPTIACETNPVKKQISKSTPGARNLVPDSREHQEN